MANDILKQLNKRPHIYGVSGLIFIDRMRGRIDVNNNQLCKSGDNDYMTPWILEKCRALSVYEHKTYEAVDQSLEDIGHRIATESQELKQMDAGSVPQGLDAENVERAAAAHAATAAKLSKRRDEILIDLNDLDMKIDLIDTALNHHIQEATQVLFRHVSAYWSGVLKKAESNDMPAEVGYEIPESMAKEVYEKHIDKMRSQIHEALGNQEV